MTKANDIWKSWLQGDGDVFVESLSNQEKSILLAWAYGGAREVVHDGYIYIEGGRQTLSRYPVDIHRAILNVVGYDDCYSDPAFAWEIMQGAHMVLLNGHRLMTDWFVNSLAGGKSYRVAYASLFDRLVVIGLFENRISFDMIATVLGE